MVAFKNVALISVVLAASNASALVIRASGPSCAIDCEPTSIAAVSHCNGPSDLDCVCNDPFFYQAMGLCILSTCPPSDLQAAEAVPADLCSSHANPTYFPSLTQGITSFPTDSSPLPTATDSDLSTAPAPTDTGAITHVATKSNTNTSPANTNSQTKPTNPPASSAPSNSAPPASTTSSKSGAVARFGNGGVFGGVTAGLVAGLFALF